MSKPPVDPKTRFAKHVALDESGCLIWTGAIQSNGYGAFALCGRGTRITAHRASWIIHFGYIPDGMNVCHRCDVRNCVNPDHLFLGTQSDNLKDAFAKGRMKVPKPDNRGERCGSSKLTPKDAMAIRSDNRLNRIVAKDYGVTEYSVSAIKRRKHWGHI